MNLTFSPAELPVRVRFHQPLTDEGLMHFCAVNDSVRVEREANGDLIVMSPAGMDGGGAESDVAYELIRWAREDGRGRGYGSNTGFRLPDGSVRAADAMWVSWEKINALPAVARKGYGPLCPEFVIEVRSESDRLVPLREKMAMWLLNGADLAWLIDPERKVVEVYRTGETTEIHEAPTSVQGSGPVRGFELVMSGIW